MCGRMQTSENALHVERSMKKASEDAMRDAQRELEALKIERQTASFGVSEEMVRNPEKHGHILPCLCVEAG